MIIDAELLFSKEQELTKTAYSTKSLNLEGELGASYGLTPFVQVVEDFVGLTGLEVQLQMAPSADTDDDDWESILTLPEKTLTQLNSTRIFYLAPLPHFAGKFIRLKYVVTGTPTAGSVTAGLILDRQDRL